MSEWSSARLCDVVNLLLGMILFFSPWLFGFSASAPWQITSPTIGLLVALLSMAALAAFAVWEECLNLIAGLCLVLSPWLLGFQNSDAMTLHVAIGTIIAALASFEVWLAYAGKRDDRNGSPA